MKNPFKPDSGMEKGRIRVLKDSNDDGRIDQSIVFADRLSEATSILRWKGICIAFAACKIYKELERHSKKRKQDNQQSRY